MSHDRDLSTPNDHESPFLALVVKAGLHSMGAAAERACRDSLNPLPNRDEAEALRTAYKLGFEWIVRGDVWDANSFLERYPELNRAFFKGASTGLIKVALTGIKGKALATLEDKQQSLRGVAA